MKLRIMFILVLLLYLSGCSLLSHKNASWNKINEDNDLKPSKASFIVKPRGKYTDTLFVLASSGGGSRAAVFTANVYLKLQNTNINSGSVESNLLAEVDAISSVSGGSLPTAYYAIAKIEGEECKAGVNDGIARQIWSEDVVRKKMNKNFQLQWFARWFLPQNIVRFWFTSYDRSDIMAQVFANTLYDRRFKPGAYTFGEICDDRPNIILNATNATDINDNINKNSCAPYNTTQEFGSLFTFTKCDFENINSSINNYSIANAVMSSSAFPAAFNYTTLRNYKEQNRLNIKNSYVHLFDGGSHDNLGLESAWTVINKNHNKFKNIVVVLIDSYLQPKGVNNTLPEARSGLDYIVDTNFLDSVDSLMAKNRSKLIDAFKKRISELKNKNVYFKHLTFDSIKDTDLKERLKLIKTSFSIDKHESNSLREAVDYLLSDIDDCRNDLRQAVIGGEISLKDC